MKIFVIFVIIFTFSIHVVNSVNSVFNTGPSFEIKDGNCSSANLLEQVFKDHTHKYPIPFATRDYTSHWAGDQTIYCVIASSTQDPSTKSTVEITEGGVNHTFVTLQVTSAKGHGFEYYIEIYGKLASPQVLLNDRSN